MMITKRLSFGFVALHFFLCAAPVHAQSAAYPSRPIRIIVGYPPASSNDTLARFIGSKLSERIGQQVVHLTCCR